MNISTIIALIFLSALIIGGIVHIIKGIISGEISVGYKYFGNGKSFTKKESLGVFYTIIGVYIICIVVCIFIAAYVIKINI